MGRQVDVEGEVVWRQGSSAGVRIPLSDEEHRPESLKGVNLNGLNGKITSMEQTTPNEVVFYPGEFDGEIIWHTRNHRKNRYPVVEDRNSDEIHPININLLTFEPGNISWWVAHVFTWGSILWVVQGWLIMWPPAPDDERASLLGPAISGFFGGLSFQFGAYFAVLEAINPRRTVEFGYRIASKLGLNKNKTGDSNLAHLVSYDAENPGQNSDRDSKWRWFALEFSNPGAAAASAQFMGACLFTCSVTLNLPKAGAAGILVENWIVADIFIWGFQVVGSCGFIYAGWVLMLETQYVWYVPNFGAIGWWVNFFNFLGGCGFWLCGFFGLLDDWKGREICCQYYGTYLSTYWGSWAFLIGSILLVIESANKQPVPPPSFLVRFSRAADANEVRSREPSI
eukprot:CAMPEP_0171579794 /NCGR_PEP_ID=MMETSP0961-20121227/8673_1 /TAXON_ID=87120 /ORGANISM="Aurantiochytrium limacinum, Strain ATCCMYA-1381" /LENGTH=396 /DNA_ID=CAMNT_0012136385 /DNA_START=189 /DNA_END=1379 /DNA_ORIENTATION=+